MSSVYLLDTNILLALILADDNLHEPATEHVEIVVSTFGEKLFTTFPCLMELTHLLNPLRTSLQPFKADQAISDLRAHYEIGLLHLTGEYVQAAVKRRFEDGVFGKEDKVIDLADYYLAELAHRIKATIITADHDILSLQGEYGFDYEVDPITPKIKKR